MVNVGDLEMDQAEIVSNLPDYFYHLTVEDILRGEPDVPQDKTALVVTGYSRDLYYKRDDENRVEAFVRNTAANRNINKGEFAVLVLSDSLPNENVFQDAFLPWFNGPFQDIDDPVWSARPLASGSGVELIHHNLKSEILREPKIREVKSWIEAEKFQF